MFSNNLHPGEIILQKRRQAEIVLVKPALIVLALIYIPWTFLIQYELHIRFNKILLFWTISVALYAINKYMIWFLNQYIFTNQRLIAIHYKSLIHKVILETPMERIHNISAETKGFLKSLFKIGDVIVQVASLVQPLVLKNLKNPENVKDFLWKNNLIKK